MTKLCEFCMFSYLFSHSLPTDLLKIMILHCAGTKVKLPDLTIKTMGWQILSCPTNNFSSPLLPIVNSLLGSGRSYTLRDFPLSRSGTHFCTSTKYSPLLTSLKPFLILKKKINISQVGSSWLSSDYHFFFLNIYLYHAD